VRGLDRKELGWPAAATLIAALVGAAVTTIAMAISPSPELSTKAGQFATSREMGEVRARLEALEQSTSLMRTEIRDDIKDLRELIQQRL